MATPAKAVAPAAAPASPAASPAAGGARSSGASAAPAAANAPASPPPAASPATPGAARASAAGNAASKRESTSSEAPPLPPAAPRPEESPATRKASKGGAGAGFSELYGNTRGAKAAAAAKQRYDEHMAEVAPFRPDTAASRQSRRLYAEASAMPRVGGPDAETLGRRIKALQEEKAAHLAALKAARDAEEAKACTFRPQRLTAVTPVRPASRAGGEAASVKGMDKFTARQAEARRLRAEAEAAAAAAEETLLTATAVPYEVFNAWKPFAAAGGDFAERRAASVAAVAAAVEAERLAACPFRPHLGPPVAAAPSPGKGGATPPGSAAKSPRRPATAE